MNYLAHLYLSGNSEELIIGNFIADTVKGNQINNYNEGIRKGITLHRKIDSFTDSHLIVNKSKERLRESYKKYSGIIVDIFYDHFLAIHWQDYSDTTLIDYSQHIYNLLNKNQHLFPAKSQLFYSYMVRNNILHRYADIKGMQKVLAGMSQRAKFVSNMEYAARDLEQHYHLFEEEFKLFFPELERYVVSSLVSK